jgi:hypothetical protein
MRLNTTPAEPAGITIAIAVIAHRIPLSAKTDRPPILAATCFDAANVHKPAIEMTKKIISIVALLSQSV